MSYSRDRVLHDPDAVAYGFRRGFHRRRSGPCVPQVDLIETFDIVQIVGEGWFGKILLVEHRGTDNEMVLKALPKNYTAVRDFYREFHFSYHLSSHRNIVSTFDVAFQTAGFYVFAQEYAPLGDLTSNISDTGIGELHSKSVARQVPGIPGRPVGRSGLGSLPFCQGRGRGEIHVIKTTTVDDTKIGPWVPRPALTRS